MGITSAVREIGRRNFLKAVSGASALAALSTTAIVRGPSRGGPVRAALIGNGKQGKILRSGIDSELMNLVAICDIKPAPKADISGTAGVRWYQDWRRMLQSERLDAVLIATPLFTHDEIATGCLQAATHVFCETAMSMDVDGCERMIQAARAKKRLLHLGHQEYYEPLYWAAYHNIVKQGVLGDIYTVETASHSYNPGRVQSVAEASNFDPRQWGYASVEELSNWRLYRRCSLGLVAEWGGSLISQTNWFFNSAPSRIHATGGIYSYKDGRDTDDHVFATLEYPNGRTATISLIQSNGFEGSYARVLGTKGTLIIRQGEALLFTEEDTRSTTVQIATMNSAQPVLTTSASRHEEAQSHAVLVGGSTVGQSGSAEAYERELAGFCGAIRAGAPLRIDPAHGLEVVRTCVAIDDKIQQSKKASLQRAQAENRSAGNGIANGQLQRA
jgi:predicted dehydrogenase